MIYKDDCDVLAEKYFSDDTLVGLCILLKFPAGSLQNPIKSTLRTLGACNSDTTRNFRLIQRYVMHQHSMILKSILCPQVSVRISIQKFQSLLNIHLFLFQNIQRPFPTIKFNGPWSYASFRVILVKNHDDNFGTRSFQEYTKISP